jgi:putative molybdopterin biosynthesis protein
VERIRRIDGRTVEIRDSAVPWKHVRSVGEDVAQGEMILPAHHRIRPVDLGVLLAAGGHPSHRIGIGLAGESFEAGRNL